MKKIFLLSALFVFSAASIFCQAQAQEDGAAQSLVQDNDSGGEPLPQEKDYSSKWYNLFGGTFTPAKSGKEFLSQISPFVNIGVNITVNTESSLKSAPSPTAFNLSFGGIWPNKAFLSFQPRLSFWWSYYLWDGQNALPAEIENRTAFVLNFMMDFPAVTTFRFEKCQLEAGLGLGLLARAALLANGVSDGDTGASGSAGGDKTEIQKYFWSNLRFLHPELFVAWEGKLTERIAAGFEARWYLPLGSLANGRGMTESIIALSAKLIF